MEVEWVKRFPLSIKNSSLLNNKPTIKFLWLVNKCFSFFDPLSGVEKYVAVIDIFGEEQMKVRQFILFMTPSLKKNGQRTLSRIFFCPTSCEAKFEVNGNGEEHSCFSRIIEKLEEDPNSYLFTREKMNEILKDEDAHCFTYEYLRVIFIMVYDYHVFKNSIIQKCVCGDIILSCCICLENYVKTLRSFYFEYIKNNKVVEVAYEKTPLSFVEYIIKEM